MPDAAKRAGSPDPRRTPQAARRLFGFFSARARPACSAGTSTTAPRTCTRATPVRASNGPTEPVPREPRQTRGRSCLPESRSRYTPCTTFDRKKKGGARFIAAAVLLVGAGEGCNGERSCVVSPVIAVTDAKSGQLLCDATVLALASDDAADTAGVAIPFVGSGGATDCAYYGRLDDRGPYAISVAAPGYRPFALANVGGIPAPCDNPPTPQIIRIGLQPN
jgi:hypothetical protein